MSQAREMKAREYNTTILAHNIIPVTQVQLGPTRNSNTFKSQTFDQTPQPQSTKHDIIFADKPLQKPVMRASY